jgi:hypothetical protein
MLVFTAALASCSPQIFSIAGGETVEKTVALNEGDICSGIILVTSGTENGLNIIILDPNQNYVIAYPTQILVTFNFTAHMTGTYTFRFDNAVGLQTKQINLNYNIKAGSTSILPRGTVINAAFYEMVAVIVIVIVVVIVAVLMVIRRRRKKRKAQPTEALSTPPPPPIID